MWDRKGRETENIKQIIILNQYQIVCRSIKRPSRNWFGQVCARASLPNRPDPNLNRGALFRQRSPYTNNKLKRFFQPVPIKLSLHPPFNISILSLSMISALSGSKLLLVMA